MNKHYHRTTEPLHAYVVSGKLLLSQEFYQGIFDQYRSIVVESFNDDFAAEIEKNQDNASMLMEIDDTRKETLSLVNTLFFEKTGMELSSVKFSNTIHRPFNAETSNTSELVNSMMEQARDAHIETLDKVLKFGAASKLADQPFTRNVFEQVKKILMKTTSDTQASHTIKLR